MKRPARLVPLRLTLNRGVDAPLWRQLAAGLRVAIANGILGPGARLPSTRELARQLDVSRTTVMLAYEDLAARDLLTGYIGGGSFVARTARAMSPLSVWFQDPSGTTLTLAPLP